MRLLKSNGRRLSKHKTTYIHLSDDESGSYLPPNSKFAEDEDSLITTEVVMRLTFADTEEECRTLLEKTAGKRKWWENKMSISSVVGL